MRAISMLLLLLFVSACAMHKEVSQRVDHELPAATSEMDGRQEAVLAVDPGVYVSTRRQPLAREARLPELEHEIDILVQVPMPLRAVLGEVEQQSGVRIRVLPDADEAVDGAAGEARGVVTEYRGPVRGLIDDLVARYGLFWRVDSDGVSVYSRETRVFEIQLPQSTADSRASVQKRGATASGGSGSGGQQQQGATSEQETTLALQSDPFPEVEAAVKALLTAKGSVTISRASRMLVVNDVPSVLDRVGELVARFNAAMNRRTMIDVTIFEVVANDSQKAGIRWDLVWESISSRYRVDTGSGPVPDLEDSTLRFGVIDETYTYGGTEVLLDALAKQGRVINVRRQQVIAANGRAVTVSRTADQAFIESVSTTQVPDVGVVQDIQQAVLSTGVSMTLFPQVLDSHDILLDTVIELSTRDQLRRVATGAGAIELPEVSRTQFSPSVKLKSGETVLLVGLSQDSGAANATGVGSAMWQGFGGGRDGSKQRSVLLVQMTAVVM